MNFAMMPRNAAAISEWLGVSAYPHCVQVSKVVDVT